MTILPAASDALSPAESADSTPMTLISGRTALTYAATPAAKPPPPTAQKIAANGPGCWRRISAAMVALPAMTPLSSKGGTKIAFSARANARAAA